MFLSADGRISRWVRLTATTRKRFDDGLIIWSSKVHNRKTRSIAIWRRWCDTVQVWQPPIVGPALYQIAGIDDVCVWYIRHIIPRLFLGIPHLKTSRSIISSQNSKTSIVSVLTKGIEIVCGFITIVICNGPELTAPYRGRLWLIEYWARRKALTGCEMERVNEYNLSFMPQSFHKCAYIGEVWLEVITSES